MLAGALKTMTNKLQLVLNVATHVVSSTQKFNLILSMVRHSELHWLDISKQISYKLVVLTSRLQHGEALQYLVDYCTPISYVAA